MRLSILLHLVDCRLVQRGVDVFADVYESACFVYFVWVSFEIAFYHRY